MTNYEKIKAMGMAIAKSHPDEAIIKIYVIHKDECASDNNSQPELCDCQFELYDKTHDPDFRMDGDKVKMSAAEIYDKDHNIVKEIKL